MKKYFTLILMLVSSLAFGAKKLPNIVLILMDDFGYGCINANGAPENLVQTPNMNSLAKEGMNFSNVSTLCSVCAPTRYGIMTGSFPFRVPIRDLQYSPLHIAAEKLTLQKMLQEKGYNTAIVGKWHMGFGSKAGPIDLRKPIDVGANSTGFNYSFIVPQNHGDVMGIFMENDAIWGLKSDEMNPYESEWNGIKFKFFGFDAPQRVFDTTQDVLNEKALAWLEEASKSDKPFYLYFATTALHAPFTPSKKNAGKTELGEYGDYILDADDMVGLIVNFLKKKNIYDDTILILTADNGADCETVDYDRSKDPNGGNPILNYMQDVQRKGIRLNGEYRLGKGSMFEGGTHIPFMLRWGKNFPQDARSDEEFSLVDIMATIAEIVDYKLERGEHAAPDSFSVLNIWKGKKQARPYIVTESGNGIRTIRKDGFKYIEGIVRDAKVERFKRLYNLHEDQKETKDLIRVFPDEAQELQDKLDEITALKMSY